MATDHLINKKRCRYYRDGSLYVSDDGTLAAMPGTKDILPLKRDSNGIVYVNHKWNFSVSIAKAVITCFCKPKPQDGKHYVIKYKDGNTHNCDYKNLEWGLVHYVHTTKTTVQKNINGVSINIHKDGTVYLKNGTQLALHDESYNADIDLFVCIEPSVNVPYGIHGKSVTMDELMKNAGYVNGDDAILNHPVILHRDYDRMNFDESNLEWVEDTDPRYITYQTKKKADVHQRNIDLNPGKVLHPGM